MTDSGEEKLLNVSEIQHFSTGDGPGIRTTVFVKGCNLHCPWCHNPETVSPLPQKLVFSGSGKTVIYGRKMSAEAVAAEVLEDREFYGADGGLTVSGGEPMLQADAVSGLMRILERDGIRTVIDTAACVPWEKFAPLLGRVQTFLVDYKTSSDETYAGQIGGDRETVIDNIRRLIGAGETVRVRVPLIPGVNTSDTDASLMCGQLAKAGVKTVDLLPFHRLGSAKYTAMGKEYAYAGISPPDAETVSRLRSIFAGYFDCFVE
ncbi:MAG: radical SAM protein [Clostridia bacterium]|nr:radical SAM protein [Clostridia bacterium]